MPDYLQRAYRYGKRKYPQAHTSRHHSLASSVNYLVTGYSTGIGPTLRVHLCSWALAGDGNIGTVNTNIGELTLITPDNRLKQAGEWKYTEALAFCEPIVYNALPEITIRVVEQEYFFDDDPADIEEMRQRIKSQLLQDPLNRRLSSLLNKLDK